MSSRQPDPVSSPAAPFEAQGEIDMSTAAAFRSHLYRYAEETQGDVIVDFAGLEFIDSSGIAALVGIAAALAGHGRRLIVTNPSPITRRAFEACGLQDVFCGSDTGSRRFATPDPSMQPGLRLA